MERPIGRPLRWSDEMDGLTQGSDNASEDHGTNGKVRSRSNQQNLVTSWLWLTSDREEF